MRKRIAKKNLQGGTDENGEVTDLPDYPLYPYDEDIQRNEDVDSEDSSPLNLKDPNESATL